MLKHDCIEELKLQHKKDQERIEYLTNKCRDLNASFSDDNNSFEDPLAEEERKQSERHLNLRQTAEDSIENESVPELGADYPLMRQDSLEILRLY